MVHPRKIEIRIHRIDSSCPDLDSCPLFATIADDPDGGYVIAKEVTDPEVLAAFADHIGPGEILGRVPRNIGPEVFTT